ncbi:MAG: hypothetical protein FWC83_00120 [Alphaproteobacteria bacterium]|nr:hypothetical protein [Alphaproteobacteria bacterium]
MKPSNIIISDITKMKDGYCVGGWDTHERRMKRLMIDGKYFTKYQIPKYSSIIVMNAPFDEPRKYPHRTEDVNIGYKSIKVQEFFEPGKQLADRLRDSVSKDVQSIFNNKVKEKSWVARGTRCASLGAILIPAQNIEFKKDGDKLRAKITDQSNKEYSIAVSCKYIRDIYRKSKSTDKLNKMVSGAQYAHCRIGLARPYYMQENHCYLMLNGVFLY